MGLFMALFAAFVIVESIRMPQRGHLGMLMSPGFVPFCTGVVLLFLSMVINVRAVSHGAMRHIGELIRVIAKDEESRRLLWILGFISLYILVLINLLSFPAATFLFHVLIFIYLKVGNWLKILFYAALAAMLVAVALPMLFEMPVP